MASLIRLIAGVVAAAAGALVLAVPAHADLLVTSATECKDRHAAKVFRPWADLSDYVLTDDGGFEAGAKGWQLDGARPTTGNEPWKVGGERDRAALALKAGGTAVSPPICVGIEHPTLRFFARGDGRLLSTLTVEVLVQTELGEVVALPLGVVTQPHSTRWSPTLPLPVLANLLPLLPGEHTRVAFRFRASGDWTIDDVYVDPYKKG